jgi:glycosyltransferase involved in cell wall biosynthesis
MISLIIPIYNQANKLSRCLDSILAQTILTSPQDLTPSLSFARRGGSASQGEEVLEVIIVNDGSTDNVESVIKKHEDRFANFLFINQENKGSNPARNRGFKESKGEYIIFCDADIEMEPEMLETMLNVLGDNKDASYAYSSFKYGWKSFKLWPWTAEKLKTMPYIHTTSLIRREAFPGFDENIKRLQDWDLWLTMLERGYAGIWINKILFKVQGGGTISSWLPSFAYKLFPFLKGVKKYKTAEEIIKEKHNLKAPLIKGV